jgi:hypothetical protein
LKDRTLDIPDSYEAKLAAWPSSGNNLFILISPGPFTREKSSHLQLADLDENTVRNLAENIIFHPVWRIPPSQNYLTYKIRDDEDNKESLVLMDLKTLETTELFSAGFLKMWAGKWSPDGNKIAFSREKELWVYDLEEKKLEKISQRNYEYEIGFDWTSDGQKFILMAPIDGENQLVIMDNNFQELKVIKIPMPFKGSISVWGLEKQAILKGTMKGALWCVDLKTEEWKKVY